MCVVKVTVSYANCYSAFLVSITCCRTLYSFDFLSLYLCTNYTSDIDQTWVQVHLYLYLSTISTTPLVLEVVLKYFLCKVHILVLRV